MKIEDVNEIFKTKYPKGKIYQKNKSKVGVIFEERGEFTRVYFYNYTSYAELLCKFGFNVQYEWDIKSYKSLINQYTEELKKGYEENIFFKTQLTNEGIEWRKKRIKHLQNIIDTAIIFEN